MLNLRLAIDGLFLSLYGVGRLLFLATLMRSTQDAPGTTALRERAQAIPEGR